MDSYWITYPMLNWRYKSCISKFVIPELWTTCVRCSHHSLPIPTYFNAFWAQFLKPRVSYVKHETNSQQFLFFDQIFQPIWKNRTNVSFDTQQLTTTIWKNFSSLEFQVYVMSICSLWKPQISLNCKPDTRGCAKAGNKKNHNPES